MKYLLAALLPLLALTTWAFAPTAAPGPAPTKCGMSFAASFGGPLRSTAAPSSSTEAAPLAVLELFTSQGCSSCPPADALLQQLNERAQAGENIIALSYHVDYWNYLGWSDPFSSPYYSARQRDYTERLRARTYTPQLVVNGRDELIGSRRSEVTKLVNRALESATPSHQLQLKTTRSGGAIDVDYTLTGPTEGHRISAILAQKHAASAVKRGENRGRDLNHHNVVRLLEHTAAKARGSFSLRLPEGLTADEVLVVLLVQEETSHAIVGAARGA